MDKVIDRFFQAAQEAKDFKLILGYQWILNASESSDLDLLEEIMKEKMKGA